MEKTDIHNRMIIAALVRATVVAAITMGKNNGQNDRLDETERLLIYGNSDNDDFFNKNIR